MCKTTLTTYLHQYEEGGLERLKKSHYAGRPHELASHTQTLKEHFEHHPPHTSAEAQAEITRLTGIQRSPTQVRAFMHRLGMRYRKTGYVPGKAATPEKQAEQETYRIEQLDPALEEARQGKRVVLFMDAAHFVQGAGLGMLWCFVRVFVASASGRKRFRTYL